MSATHILSINRTSANTLMTIALRLIYKKYSQIKVSLVGISQQWLSWYFVSILKYKAQLSGPLRSTWGKEENSKISTAFLFLVYFLLAPQSGVLKKSCFQRLPFFYFISLRKCFKEQFPFSQFRFQFVESLNQIIRLPINIRFLTQESAQL